MKKISLFIGMMLLFFLLGGCSNNSFEENETNKDISVEAEVEEKIAEDYGKVEEVTKLPERKDESQMVKIDGELAEVPGYTIVEKPENIAKVGTPFASTLNIGNLYYTIDKTMIYDSATDAGLKQEDFIYPYNVYDGKYAEYCDTYNKISDYVKDDGSLDENNQLVILDITIRNEDAEGLVKKNVFHINNLCLYGENPASCYEVAYFSEAGKENAEQLYHYILDQGQEIHVQVGFLVLKEDINSLVGVINKNEYKELEVYFEIY